MAKSSLQSRKFHFKLFSLSHHRSTMKVGMDSTLLGSWANADSAKHILDIGSGCGILSLILACESQGDITAVELDAASAQEAKENFDSSSFSERMTIINEDFNHFASGRAGSFDLIISNPPFFINDHRSEDQKKTQARHGDALSFGQLLDGVDHLLSDNGKFYLVLPYDESRFFLQLAKEKGLFLQKQQVIFPFRGSLPNRINLQLGKQNKSIVTELLMIREEDGNFSKEYIQQSGDLLISSK